MQKSIFESRPHRQLSLGKCKNLHSQQNGGFLFLAYTEKMFGILIFLKKIAYLLRIYFSQLHKKTCS